MKRIALIGNMNNNFFACARHLKDRGYEVGLFLLNNEMSHFMPECDTYDLSHRAYTTTLNFGNPYWFLDEIKRIDKFHFNQIELIKSYDCIMACGSALGFLQYYNINVDIFVPYGSDSYELPFYVPSQNPKHREHLDTFSKLQAKAIKNSKYILSTFDFLMVDCYAEPFKKLEATNKMIGLEYFPFIYENIYTPNEIPNFFNRSYWAYEFQKMRQSSNLIIFAPARHFWCCGNDNPDSKANDLLIKAFSTIKKEHEVLNPLLVFFEYGPDIAASKTLISDLGLTDSVVWLPQMNRKDIMVGLYYSDIVAESFAIGYSMGGVIAEAIVAHKMLLKHTDYSVLENRQIYQSLDAKSSEEIIHGINNFNANREYYRQIAISNFRWFKTQSDNAIKQILTIVKNT